MSEVRTPLLHVEGLKQHFRINRRQTTKAVDGISLISMKARPTVWSASPVRANPRPAERSSAFTIRRTARSSLMVMTSPEN